ncbi:MAG: hypothetical protein OXG17_10065 [Chloroflexi bacterium]|nr:hypothetical protein [Chloroflexota bacterium]
MTTSEEPESLSVEVYAQIIPSLPPGVLFQLPAQEIDFQAPVPDGGMESKFVGAMDLDIVGGHAKTRLVFAEADPDFDSIRNSILKFMESFINLYNYVHCRFHAIHIESMLIKRSNVLVDNQDYTRVPGWGELEAATQDARAFGAEQLLSVISNDVQFSRALNDLRNALANHYDTSFYAYRAIESIKAAFMGDNESQRESGAEGWETMRSSLRISRQFIMEIKRSADLQRHGQNTLVVADERLEAMRRAWTVVGRYVHYCIEGKRGLDDGYPLLE